MAKRIFDCFIFFKELDLLEIRLHELYDKVDFFILCEATRTFQDRLKPLVFRENRHRFARFLDKIIHVVVEDMPEGGESWGREHFQRAAIRRGLVGLDAEDIVIVSDLDEIIRAGTIDILQSRSGYFMIDMPMYQFYLNTCAIPEGWNKAFAYSFRLDDRIGDFGMVRVQQEETFQKFVSESCKVEKGGWHFTYIGGAESVREKLSAYSHTGGHYEAMLADGSIEQQMVTGLQVGGGAITRLHLIDDSFPRHVRANIRHYETLGFIKTPMTRLRELEQLYQNALYRLYHLETEQQRLYQRIADATRVLQGAASE